MTVASDNMHRRFALEWLVDKNATKAAERAGYSPKTAHVQGSALLKLPDVQALIQAKEAEILSSVQAEATSNVMTAQEVLQEYSKIAVVNLADVVVVEGGKTYMDLSKMTRDQWACVSEVMQQEIVRSDKAGGNIRLTRVKLIPKNVALEALSRYHGLFAKDAPAVNVNLTLEQLIIQAINIRKDENGKVIEEK